ncbi:MAG: hypothetical protein CMJ45_13905 [Planctomyces sp.]|jgi:L-fuconolactonase|nr:hypothetical protein [Planctomyces sp.]MDP7277521.1 amidohydrolase family protein [Planctomycetaceae bacterium]
MSAESRGDRREFLQAAAVTTASTAALSAPVIADDARKLVIVDCHAHIYGTAKEEKRYPTKAEPLRPPRGTGTIAHLKRNMKENGVAHVTAVQTSSYYRWDNRFTADAARRHSDFMVGIITLDPDEPQNPWVMEHLVEKYNVRGMRSIPGKDGRMDSPGVERLWSTAERLGIVINSLTSSKLKPQVAAMAARHPRLRVVIDHCLNIAADDSLDATVAHMQDLAKLPNVHAKLTFIPTGTRLGYPGRDLHDACREMIKAFGANRCVWGSDFPCELWCKNSKISYAQHLRIFTHELGLDQATKREILGGTALRLWFGRK